MCQYLLDHQRVLDAGDDFHAAATDAARFDVDIEYPLQTLRPAHRCMAYNGCCVFCPVRFGLVSSMARKDAAELHIIHVWSLFGELYLHSIGLTEKEFQEAKEYEKEQHKRNFDTLLNRVDVTDLKLHVHLVEGDPVEDIPKLVTELGIDLLVMGSVGRAGIAGFLIGNTAEEVFNQMDCSLLTLKPKGFVTPLKVES